MSVSIGELTGTLTLEDEFEKAFGHVVDYVKEGAQELEGLFGGLVIGVGAVAAAVTGVALAIAGTAAQGAELKDIHEGFDRLAGSVENADEILQAMRKGVVGTVDDIKLMQDANRALTTGAAKTAEQFGTITAASRVLSREGFGPIEQQMATIERALATGRTRSLQYMTGVIDLKGAEEAYAKSLGVTREQLSAQGKLHADQIAIFDKLNQKVNEAGNQELNFAEKMKAVRVSVRNWLDDLFVGVSELPSVNKAFDDIAAAISRAFGGSSVTLREGILEFVDKFAGAVGHYGPIIIKWMRDTYDNIIGIWHAVQEAWDLVPDWFKNIARDAALAGGSVYLLSKAFGAVKDADVLGDLASIAQIVGTLPLLFTSTARALETIKILGFADTIAYLMTPLTAMILAFSTTLPEALVLTAAGFASIAIPIAAAAAAITAAYQAYMLWKEHRERQAADQRQDIVDAANLERINKALGTSYTKLADAVEEANKRRKQSEFVGPMPPAGYRPSSTDHSGDIGSGAGDKLAQANEALTSKSEQLWDEYYQNIAKAGGDSFGAQIDAIDRWYDREYSAIQKSKADWQHRNEAIDALNSDLYAKTEALQMEFTEKSIEASRKAGEEGAAAVAKGLAGQKDVLMGLAQATATFSEESSTRVVSAWHIVEGEAGNLTSRVLTMTDVVEKGIGGLEHGALLTSHALEGIPNEIGLIGTELDKTTNSFKDTATLVSERLGKAFQDAYNDMKPLAPETQRWIEELDKAGVSAEEIANILHLSLGRVKTELDGSAKAMKTNIEEIFKSLPDTLMRSFEGGGNLVGAMKSLAVQIGNVFVDTLTAAFKKAAINGQSALNSVTMKAAMGVGALAGGTAAASGAGVGGSIGAAGSAAIGVGTSAIAGGATIGAAVALSAATLGIGAAAVLAVIAIKKLFSIGGPSQSELTARSLEAQLEKTAASSATTADRIRADMAAIDAASGPSGPFGHRKQDVSQLLLAESGLHNDLVKAGMDDAKAWDYARDAFDRMMAAEKKGPAFVQQIADQTQAFLEQMQKNHDFASQFGPSKAELTQAAADAKAGYEYMRQSGQYSADQIAQAFRKAEEAAAAAGDVAAKAWLAANGGVTDFAQAAKDAGYESLEDLRKDADAAEKLAEYMRDSGKYSADAVAEAFQKASDAATKAAGISQKLLDQQKTLSDAVSAEAPEDVMGTIEKQQRAQLDAVNKQIEDQKKQYADLGKAAATGIETATGATGEFNDAMNTAADDGGAHLDAAAGTVAATVTSFTPSDVGQSGFAALGDTMNTAADASDRVSASMGTVKSVLETMPASLQPFREGIDDVGHKLSADLPADAKMGSDGVKTAFADTAKDIVGQFTVVERVLTDDIPASADVGAAKIGASFEAAAGDITVKMQAAGDNIVNTMQVAADQIAAEFGLSAAQIEKFLEDAANAAGQHFVDAAHEMQDAWIASARDAAAQVAAAFAALNIHVPVTYDVGSYPGAGTPAPAPNPPGGFNNKQVPMAEGGAGYATGPMTFTTKGNEFYAFGGEGQGASGLLSKVGAQKSGPVTIQVFVGSKLAKEAVFDELENAPSTRDIKILKGLVK